ncbi:YqgE/AlgH family protein [Aliiroseovarius sp.]|uniref:YqgE/AlgH family protein n=1 Tax=Aliiroseovarius sp. TaxID=1872442 RepID=UPI00261D05FA|nr:YqgE/AlgH family protein [Aliiroseovarius sp.]
MDTATETPNDLSGQLLIAMPGMGDPRFEKSVVFLCAHSAEGAMGLIVNKPTPDLALDDLLDQLDIDKGAGSRDVGVFFGGPVETGRGFVLHSRDYHGSPSTLQVDEAFSMTATRDILEDIARGLGPAQSLAALGYAGWAPGQLEGELQQNAWLTVDADEMIVFSADIGGKWSAALAKLGIDPLLLSAEGGRA